MSFMQKQVTVKCVWIEVETTQGTEWIDGTGFNIRDSQTETHPLSHKQRESIISQLSDYCEGKILEWKTIKGHGARLSAPGYMDCTEWTVFETEQEAEDYLEENYPDEEEN